MASKQVCAGSTAQGVTESPCNLSTVLQNNMQKWRWSACTLLALRSIRCLAWWGTSCCSLEHLGKTAHVARAAESGQMSDMELAENLMHTCYETYRQTPTGLAAEITHFLGPEGAFPKAHTVCYFSCSDCPLYLDAVLEQAKQLVIKAAHVGPK